MKIPISMRAFAILLSSALCVISFQNCSQVNFSQDESNVTLSCEPLKPEAMEPVLLWDWKTQLGTAISDYPPFDQVMSSPMVADLDGDKIPEVVFVTWNKDVTSLDNMTAIYSTEIAQQIPAHHRNGVLRIVNGSNGKTKFSIGDLNLAPIGDHSPLLIDLDNDGKTEIIYLHYLRNKVIALNYDGSFRWKYDFAAPLAPSFKGFNAFDLDQDGLPEFAVGPVILAEKNLQPFIKVQLANHGMGLAQQIGISLDKGNSLDIVDGTSGVYDKTGALKFAFEAPGNIGVGDLITANPGLEIAVVNQGIVKIYSAIGVTLKTIDLKQDQSIKCESGLVGGGTISIANFDGNEQGKNQMAIATGRYFSIIDSDGTILAKSETRDCSSLTTGITTFDFNGDKKPEILYADEQYFRVYYFEDNQLREALRLVNPSGTLAEYPVVADITGDGSSEILVPANNYVVSETWYNNPFEQQTASGITGVRAFAAKNRKWMPTRPIWNQFDYIPGNINNQTQVSSNYSNPGFDIVRRNAVFEGKSEVVCTSP